MSTFDQIGLFFSVITHAGVWLWVIFLAVAAFLVYFIKANWDEPGLAKRLVVCGVLIMLGLGSVLNEGRKSYGEALNEKLWDCGPKCKDLRISVREKLDALGLEQTVKFNDFYDGFEEEL